MGFVGIAPGFAYLTCDDPELVVPRRATPRTRVPVGAVAAGTVMRGGLRLRARGTHVVAVTGAMASLTVHPRDGGPPRELPLAAAVALADGEELDVATPARGQRCYVAVRGGFDVVPTLGSRSTDVLAGLGPAPLRAGDVLRTTVLKTTVC